MTREEILKLATQCGAPDWWSGATDKNVPGARWLTAFFHAAQRLEREACAKVCDAIQASNEDPRPMALGSQELRGRHTQKGCNMNLIPTTQEQVSEWIRTTQLEPHGEGWSREQRIAELAAQWGYEQATNFKPDLANYYQWRKDGKAEALEQATPTSTVDFLPHDDYLRFAQRVLEGDAPESDRKEAARMICDIRRALYIQRGKQTKVEGS